MKEGCREYLLSDEWVLGEFLNSIFIGCFISRTLPKLLLSLFLGGWSMAKSITLKKRKIENGAVVKSYISAFPHILGSPSSYMTLQLFHSEFPNIWGKFDFYFYQWSNYPRLNMELDLQSLFGLHATWCTQLYSLAETPQLPLPAFGHVRCTRALLVR